MNKEVQYSGLAAHLPGRICPDGEFDAVMGLWPENGAYRPVLPSKTIMTLSAGETVVYQHAISSARKNYIIVKESSTVEVSYKSAENPNLPAVSLVTLGAGETFEQATSLGNTLLLVTSECTRYYLWKPSGYQYLGTHLPELDLSFGLQAEYKGEFIPVGQVSQSEYSELSEEKSTMVTSRVWAGLNKYIAENATNAGKFIFPFVVRYAYRLFNGSLTMQSAPILMQCAAGPVPVLTFGNGESLINGMINSLDYVCSQAQKTELEGWKDIISAVEIFVSAPIWTIKQGEKITQIVPSSTFESTRNGIVCKWTNSPFSNARSVYAEFKHSKIPLYQYTIESAYYIKLPEKSDFSFEKEVAETCNFYLLKTIKPEDLATERTVIEVGSEYLQSLVNRERLTDDWDSHDSISANHYFQYNQRLNLANIKKSLYGGYQPQTMFTYCDAKVTPSFSSTSGWSASVSTLSYTYRFLYHITQGERDVVVESKSTWGSYPQGRANIIDRSNLFSYIYYPNTNAKKVTIIKYSGSETRGVVTFPLEPHPFLNGAYLSKWGALNSSAFETLPAVSEDNSINLQNKLYTSEVGNPFLFPVTNINTIGIGEILGISAAAKPMSTGQFGQFPLYAFSTDGIWAMSVSDTGGYSAKQPISMEVCIPGTITQLDNSVAFSTGRGIMNLSGSDVICITETIDGKSDNPFRLAEIPQATAFLGNMPEMQSFRSFIGKAKTIYDNLSQRLIIFNPDCSYAYLFAMDGSKQWGAMKSNITQIVNSYPQALAMTSNNTLVDFAYRGSNGIPATPQVIVTRPLKLDAMDVFKKVTTVIQRGDFAQHAGETNPNPVQTILYGSIDLVNWFLVGSSVDEYLRGIRGTSYKYFRLVLPCYLRDDESISGCSIEFEPELVNNMR